MTYAPAASFLIAVPGYIENIGSITVLVPCPLS
jgi:hypothetical protein